MRLFRISLIITMFLIMGFIVIIPAYATEYTNNDFMVLDNWNNNEYLSITNGVMTVSGNPGSDVYITTKAANLPLTGDYFNFEVDFTPVSSTNAYYWIGLNSNANPGNNENMMLMWRQPMSQTYVQSGASLTANNYQTLNMGQTYHLKLVKNASGLYGWIDNTFVGSLSSSYTPLGAFFNILGTTTQNYKLENMYYNSDPTKSWATDEYNLNASTTTVSKSSVDTVMQINITRLNADNVHASTVDYTIVNGTAFYGSDMTATAQTGTVSFGASDTYKLVNITIKGTSTYTGNRSFTFAITNPTNGVTLGSTNTSIITITDPLAYDATAVIVMAQDPVTLFTNATGTLIITDPNNLYDEIDWYNNGKQIRQFKLTGSQWQQWNGTAWVNCANSSVFTVSQYQDWAGTSNFYAWIKYNGNVVLGVNKNFEVVQNATQTTYYLRVVDSVGADLSSFSGHFFESEAPAKDYTFTWSGYGAVLDLNRHYQGTITADGFINGTIAFETTYNNSSAATYRTIVITMVSSDTPTNPAQAYLDVKVYDSSSNEMVPDAVFTLTNTSGSKTYQIYGTVKRITIEKGMSYSWKASSSSYYSMTGTVNMTDGQAMLTIPLNPIPAPTATPVPSTGYYTGSDGQATYTPYTDTQRQNQAMTMIDQLLEAGPSLMQLGILAVFMGLVMMLFPDGKKRRYR